jgi:uncharacterized protein (TIGR03435 family)
MTPRIVGAAGLLAAIAFVNPSLRSAQATRPAMPKWEVVAIRRCDPGTAPDARGVSGSPGRLHMPCTEVKYLIQWAYSSYANGAHFNAGWSAPIEGAPSWINSDEYMIDAKAEGNPSVLTMFAGPMMQALLEGRFKLKIHRATREVPVYALTVAKGGPKLQPFKEGSCVDWEDSWDHPRPPQVSGQPRIRSCRVLGPANKGLEFDGTMREFCARFANVFDRPVIDKTGIAGMFTIHLDLSFPDLGIPGDVVANVTGTPQSGRPALDDPADRFDAVRTAVRKIGLSLEATKGPQEILVIDHIERPSEN